MLPAMTTHARQTSRLLARLPRHMLATLVALVALQLAADTTTADQRPAQAAPQIDVPVIDAEELIDLALTNPALRIVDSRLPSDRKLGFIEGSINLPDTDTNCERLAELLSHKDVPVAFYCNGPKCERSARAAATARLCGYRESYWFRGGFEEWVAKRFPTVID